MKKGLLFLYITLTLSGFSQTDFRFADSTAQWNVLSISTGGFTPPGHSSTTISQVEGDTIIEGINYQKIISFLVRRDSLNRVYVINWPDTNEYLLYDFSRQAGDTIAQLGISGYEVTCVIDSIDSVLLDYPRKRMHVHYPTMFISDVWIDGIGSLHDMFFFPQSTLPQIPESPNFELLCFFEKGQLLYHHPDYDTCYVQINVGVQEIRNPQSEFRIAPNPATASVTISIDESLSAEQAGMLGSTATISDVMGRKVAAVNLTTQYSLLNTANFLSGVYFVTVTTKEGKSATKKLVVSK